MNSGRAIQMDPKDNVATAIADIEAGASVSIVTTDGSVAKEVIAKESIPLGHKLAIRGIGPTERIVKYGAVIGEASKEIGEGEYVHVHNVESLRIRRPR